MIVKRVLDKRESAVFWLYSFSVFINSYLYLTWSTYSTSISTILKYVPYLICFVFWANAFIHRKRYLLLTKSALLVFLLSVLLCIHINFFGKVYFNTFSYGDTLLLFSILVLLLLKDAYRRELFNRIVKTFAVICIPGLLYFILYKIGIMLPHDEINSVHEIKKYTMTYLHYPLGLLFRNNTSGSIRFCAVFDEPGFVGTIAGLLFVCSFKKIKKVWSFILFVEGLFTLSIAFIIMIVVFIFINMIINKKFKLVLLLLLFFISLIVVGNIKTDNQVILYLQSRIDFSSFGFFANNRTSDSFENEFNLFMQNGGYQLFMGNGFEAANRMLTSTSSFSYKMLIFDYGFVGFAVYIGLFFIMFLFAKNKKACLPFFIVFILSIYQRPYVFNVLYMAIFISGLGFCNYQSAFSFAKKTTKIHGGSKGLCQVLKA